MVETWHLSNDPNYMKRNYKANAHMIQNLFDEREYEKIVKFEDEEDE